MQSIANIVHGLTYLWDAEFSFDVLDVQIFSGFIYFLLIAEN